MVSVGRTSPKIFLNPERNEKKSVLQLLILKNAKYLPPAIIIKDLLCSANSEIRVIFSFS